MCTAALFTIANRWKQPNVHQLLNGYRKSGCYMHTMKYYSAVERNEVLVHVRTWMNLKNFMLSENSRDKSHIFNDSIYVKYPEYVIP